MAQVQTPVLSQSHGGLGSAATVANAFADLPAADAKVGSSGRAVELWW
jgi:hypothetical protein